MFFHPSTHFSIITKISTGIFILVTALSLGQSARIYFNDTGVVAGATVESNASVPENEINSWNAQLQKKEASLHQQQIEILTTQHQRDQRIMTYLFTIAAVLLVLILINFYLDFRRQHHHSWNF